MSIQAIAWVLENSEAEGYDRLVLLAIANHADARGMNAYPSIPLIAREARVHRSTVFRSLARLENLGEVVVVRDRAKRRCNEYIVPVDISVDRSQAATLATVAAGDSKGRSVRLNRSQWSDPNRSNRHEPSRAHAREPTDTSPVDNQQATYVDLREASRELKAQLGMTGTGLP